jgi:hypothetical protein
MLHGLSPAAAKIPGPAAQKTQQHQALTQAASTSTKHEAPSRARASWWQLSQAASGFCLAGRQNFYAHGAEEPTATAGTRYTLTQAPSTKQSKSKPVAAQSGRLAGSHCLWLLAPGFMASDFCLACLAGRQNFWACGAIDGRWECTGRPPLLSPGRGS